MTEYPTFFERLCGHVPYAYQERVAAHILEDRNVVLRAPTGAGKTRAVIVPFLYGLAMQRGAGRLIYVLPMRTLAQGIHREAHALWPGEKPAECVPDAGPVRLQTGEAPGDPFMSEGRVIVATYDQLLSGLLHEPYGKSDRLHNINGAAMVGALVVFDEFHLMEIGASFLTAAAFAKWFDGLCQTVWMTATATSPLVQLLERELACAKVELTREEERALPPVGQVTRGLDWADAPLLADEILAAHKRRSIALCNTVGRAQVLATELRRRASVPVILLHSRFFQRDRKEKEERLRARFGKEATEGGILVATQVVEAGLNISSEHLWTEICPVNALVQRAGRCARFPGEGGTVHVRGAPNSKPYEDTEIDAARATLPIAAEMTPATCKVWVERAHGAADSAALQSTTLAARLMRCRDVVRSQVRRTYHAGVSELIRRSESNVFVLVRRTPPGSLSYDKVRIARGTLIGGLSSAAVLRAWKLTDWGPAGPQWDPVTNPRDVTMVTCVSPDTCRYDEDGLRIGIPGTIESMYVQPPERPGHKPLKAETWLHHAQAVGDECIRRIQSDALQWHLIDGGLHRRWSLSFADLRTAAWLAAALHDLGKLQQGWQRWAHAVQRHHDPGLADSLPLAHTDGDAPVQITRPPHANASAWMAEQLKDQIAVGQVPSDDLWACILCAIVAHHGGWLDDRDVQGVSKAALDDLWKLLGRGAWAHDLAGAANAKTVLEYPADCGEEWWPVASLLTRLVRLSDQRATADWSESA